MVIRAYKFKKIGDAPSYRKGAIRMDSMHVIASVRDMEFATIDKEDGTITKDVTNPNTKPLVLLKVKPISCATFHVLTDGEIYYPLSGNVNLKYCPSLILLHGPLSELDQMLIGKAVKYFTSLFA